MTLSSRHRIRNSSPGNLTPSTLYTSRSRRLSTILSFTRGWGRNILFLSTEPRTLAWKAAVLTTTLGPPPMRCSRFYAYCIVWKARCFPNDAVCLSQHKSPHQPQVFRRGLYVVTSAEISLSRRTKDAVCIFSYEYLSEAAKSNSAVKRIHGIRESARWADLTIRLIVKANSMSARRMVCMQHKLIQVLITRLIHFFAKYHARKACRVWMLRIS